MEHIAATCPRLEVLSLHCCRAITDVGVVAVAKGCPRLRSINLSYCTQVTAAALKTLLAKCTELTSYNDFDIILAKFGYVRFRQRCRHRACATHCSMLRADFGILLAYFWRFVVPIGSSGSTFGAARSWPGA